jgi:hypothetical protein
VTSDNKYPVNSLQDSVSLWPKTEIQSSGHRVGSAGGLRSAII